MAQQHSEGTRAGAFAKRRAFERVRERFDGRRIGTLETPVTIYDLNEGGCFINSQHEQQVGVSIRLKIDLPDMGWITVGARTLYRQAQIGFAVCFTDMPEETANRLHEALEDLRNARLDR